MMQLTDSKLPCSLFKNEACQRFCGSMFTEELATGDNVQVDRVWLLCVLPRIVPFRFHVY